MFTAARSGEPRRPVFGLAAASLTGRRARIIVLLAGGVVAALWYALGTGAVPISLATLFEDSDAGAFQRMVFAEIRSPRVLLAAFVGSSLALSGASLQGLFRNPLADPGLIGVSSGAALGAIAMIVVGSALEVPDWLNPYLLPLAAVVGGGLVTLFIYLFAQRFGQFSIVTILLLGIAVNALAGVGIGAFQYLSDDAQLRTLTFWMMGSFGRATWPAVLPAVALMVLAGTFLLGQQRALDRLQLGEAEARHVGVDVLRVKRLIVLMSAVAAGAGVAVAGAIGFVGLVVPHLARLMGGAAHGFVLPASVLLGGALMVCADLVARMAVIPAELPVGLVTSAIGAPFFLWLIARARPG